MFVVGLTGGIGSGKSTVANLFNEFEICIVDADQLSRDLVVPGSQALQKIEERFGSEILTPNGQLDRSHLRYLIFSNSDEKTWLEGLLHPLIKQEAKELLSKACSPYSIYVAPLLIEKKLSMTIDRILVVDTPEALQIARSSSRDNQTPEDIQKIIDSQIAREKRLEYADDIIDNSQDIIFLKQRVADFHSTYLKLSKSKAQKNER